ncbi:MAG: hypothetical protein ACLQBA_11125 [Candidatus Binataceae bacterium]
MEQTEQAVQEQPVSDGVSEAKVSTINKSTDHTKRPKSKIQFPYADLENAIGVAKKLFEKAGQQRADMSQVVAWLGHESSDSGAFRLKFSIARIFGLIDVSDDGKQVWLSDIGIRIVDSENDALAKVQAFLAVPLFKAMFDRYKGRMLPGDDVVETEMEGLGVVPKQKDRARQVFSKSAEQAGLFTYGKGRLILPGGVSEAMLTSEAQPNGARQLPPAVIESQGSATDNPMITLLVQTLPAPGTVFPEDAQEQWFRTVRAIFDRVYVKNPR